MSDDIRAGDVVECIFVDPSPQVDPWEPHIGGFYRCVDAWRDGEFWLLNLDEDPNQRTDVGWDAAWFRKLDKAKDCFSEAMRNLVPAIPKLEPITVEIRMPNPEIWENLP